MSGVEQEEQLEPSEEWLRVIEWRRDELLRAVGGDYMLIVDALAASHADLHEILRAHSRGCPPELLVRIFLD